jgi:hypothetical protein
MNRLSLLLSLSFVVLLSTTALSGCMVAPAPRYEVVAVAPRPGWVWEPSHWVYTPHARIWVRGHWVRRY